MKLIMENWRGYLSEAEDPKQLEILRGFVENIFILAQASEDAGEEIEEGAGRKAKMDRKANQQRTKEIKKTAGLIGIKIADFTPEQRKLFNDAKQIFIEKDEAWELKTMNVIAHGNMLEAPIVQELVALGGRPLKLALTTALGECGNKLTLRCLTKFMLQYSQFG